MQNIVKSDDFDLNLVVNILKSRKNTILPIGKTLEFLRQYGLMILFGILIILIQITVERITINLILLIFLMNMFSTLNMLF